ncbi:GNAT family N-acetyltransferase [Kitasatospora sp. NPDC004240]
MTDRPSIRALRTPDDYPSLARLLGTSAGELAAQDAALPRSNALELDGEQQLTGHGRVRLLAVSAGDEALGFATAWRAPWTPPGDLASTAILAEGQPDSLYSELVGALEQWATSTGATRLLGELPDDEPGRLRLLLERGHVVDAHLLGAETDLVAGEPPSLPGIALGTLATDPAPDAAARLHELYRLTLPDNPGFVDALPDLATWRAEVLDGPACRPDWVFTAHAGAALVGVTAVQHTEQRDTAYVDYTAVHPDWRGRGLARALKLTAARRLAAAGIRRLRTEVEAGNAPMLAVNAALGYRLLPGHRRMVRLLQHPR